MVRTMLVVMNLVIVTIGGGNLSLVNAEDLGKSVELPRARKERYRAKRFLREWLTSSHSVRLSLRSAGFRLQMADQLFHLERPVFLLLGKTSELGCCGDQLNHRMLRSIPESVLRAAGNFFEIPRTSRDPMCLSTLVAEHLNIPRKNEEGLDASVTMNWHRNARRNRSSHDARSLIAWLRCNQKLNAWSEHLKCLAITFNYNISK